MLEIGSHTTMGFVLGLTIFAKVAVFDDFQDLPMIEVQDDGTIGSTLGHVRFEIGMKS